MATFAVRRGDPVFRKEDCSPFDIGLVYSRMARFADGDKFRFIQNIRKPDALYKLHVSGNWWKALKIQARMVSSLSLACVLQLR